MGIVHGPQVAEELNRKLLPDNPFIPPKDNSCLINLLPPELLSCIFEVGTLDDEFEEEDEMIAQSWNKAHPHRFDKMSEASMGTSDADINITGEEDANEEASSVMTGSSDTSPPSPPFQIIVSHVCRHWRSVAFSTPSLWTYIAVPPCARSPYEHVSTLLERSKSLPIDIFIDCEPRDRDEDSVSEDEDEDGPSEADLKLLFALLVPHVHRWRSMEVQVLSYEHMYAFLTAVSDSSVAPASQLATLQLYHHDEEEESFSSANPNLSKHFTLFGGSAPCLKNLALWGVHVDWSQSWLTSASNLVALDLEYHAEDVRPSWTAFTTILRGAPALESLSLRSSGPSGNPAHWVIEPNPAHTDGDLNDPIQLLKLTDLDLAFHSPAYASGLLRKLHIPALRSLALDFEDGDYTEFITHLAEPTTTVGPLPANEQPRSLLSGIETLKISGLPCSDQSVLTLYGELNILDGLNLSMDYLSDVFLDLLCMPTRTFVGHNFIWLPRLKTLFVSGTSGNKIREVVQNRRDAGVPLKSIYVEESCDVDDDDVEWIKDNVEMFEFFEGSDDEDVVDIIEDMEDGNEWSDMD
ncbi:hypothetical protein PAXRUDRAFT_761602 [Paxillus rubicundulus Ve08.2h10]|uniref:F-box domain-containing protein n=1 Tax=Paxillus rubicundulus Ve08.2h10 TaxID=930991 RepID=A0A0D0DB95_9AGAM|nr:hypothetical protein PAXRUDRAFT_761602 [Paxillus rubicundulus Ve08.2h10]